MTEDHAETIVETADTLTTDEAEVEGVAVVAEAMVEVETKLGNRAARYLRR